MKAQPTKANNWHLLIALVFMLLLIAAAVGAVQLLSAPKAVAPIQPGSIDSAVLYREPSGPRAVLEGESAAALAEAYNTVRYREAGGRPMNAERICITFRSGGETVQTMWIDENLTASGPGFGPGNSRIENGFDYQWLLSLMEEG